jgi:hypothetical protein
VADPGTDHYFAEQDEQAATLLRQRALAFLAQERVTEIRRSSRSASDERWLLLCRASRFQRVT